MPKPKNYIEIHCYMEGEAARDNEYELFICVAKTKFGHAGGWLGRSSVRRAARRISKATGLPIRDRE